MLGERQRAVGEERAVRGPGSERGQCSERAGQCSGAGWAAQVWVGQPWAGSDTGSVGRGAVISPV